MALVCIDTMVAIWAVKKTAGAGQEHMIPLCTQLLADLDKDKKKILLPAPVITELLAPVDDDAARLAMLRDCNLLFRTGALDPIAATLSARVWNENKTRWKGFYSEHDPNFRNRFKYDLMILGIAMANKVECFYTGDKALFGLAKQYIDTKNVFDLTTAPRGTQYSLLMPSTPASR